MYLLETIGTLTARKDEGNLTLALKEQDLRNGVPLLIKKKKIKGTDVTVREFYSNIPFHTWIESKEAIADSMNVHFVEPAIEYGGKKKNNGKRIVIYTAKGRKPVKRGELYDEEL